MNLWAFLLLNEGQWWGKVEAVVFLLEQADERPFHHHLMTHHRFALPSFCA